MVGHARDVLHRLVVPEKAAHFRSEKLFAAGKRDAFDRRTGRRPWRKTRGGLPEEHDVTLAVFFDSVERGGIHRRVSKGGRGVRHLP